MRRLLPAPLGRFALRFAAGLAGLALLGFLFAWSGLYSVAASRGHWAAVEWFLAFTMRNSVETHALTLSPPPLDDPGRVLLGAGHFQSGCAPCHGAPGQPRNPIIHQMLPPPPDLAVAAKDWKPRELFWIVKHGLKYTGMPGWAATRARDDEVWSMVAFLRVLPALTPERYAAMAFQDASTTLPSAQELVTAGGSLTAPYACARCHGAGADGPQSELVPILHGQRAAYLERALREYAIGRRSSGFMQPIAHDLSPRLVRDLAAYYAGLPQPARELPAAPDDGRLAVGEELARQGDPANGLPPCLSCHGTGGWQSYPRLGGQHAAYLEGQLRLWQRGFRDVTVGGAIMAPIARRLSNDQVEAAAFWFSRQRPAEAAR